LKNQKEKAQREAKERAKNSSKSSSNYNPFPLQSGSSSDGDGAETCPYCGSEAIYESGSGYRCAECGHYISNPDDLNLNYEEGYYELILPSFSYSMNLC
jgi:DNA-directed RNA polymerase subunit RPC12/RpoP